MKIIEIVEALMTVREDLYYWAVQAEEYGVARYEMIELAKILQEAKIVKGEEDAISQED